MQNFERVDKRSGRTASDKSFCAVGRQPKVAVSSGGGSGLSVCRLRDSHRLGIESFADSALEGNGFELPVPEFRSSIFYTAPEPGDLMVAGLTDEFSGSALRTSLTPSWPDGSRCASASDDRKGLRAGFGMRRPAFSLSWARI